MMQLMSRLALPAAVSLLVASCSAPYLPEVPSDVPVRAGMTRKELTAALGAPLRKEARAGGGEIWYYRFRIEGIYTMRKGSNEWTKHDENKKPVLDAMILAKEETQAPLQVSAEGKVTGEIPKGRILAE
jgi:outer membrane protein assembly factor BamE (lipoprotein component of BamABCDE complex)